MIKFKWENANMNIYAKLEKNNYLSYNQSLNELALRICTNKEENDFDTFIIEDGDIEDIPTSSYIDIYKYFILKTNGVWSNDIELLKEYVSEITKDKNGTNK